MLIVRENPNDVREGVNGRRRSQVRLQRRTRREGATLAAAIVFAAVALVFLAAGPVRAASFPDVGGDEWFAEAVQVLSEEGIVQGRSDGTFGPYQPVTRAEFAVFVGRSLGLSSGTTHPFADLPPDAWYGPAVAALYELGLVNGVTSTTFDPQGMISRQQAASLVIRAFGYSLSLEPAEGLDFPIAADDVASWLQGFPDRGFIATAHQPAVAEAYRLQIVTGYSDGRFYPLGEVTRAQCVGMLYAALYQTPSPLTDPPPAVPDVSAYPNATTGSRGAHVSLLEQRLTELTYRPGPVDGVFDYRTRMAVIAFQKWEGLSRTGEVNSATWARLMSASAPVARQSGSGIWIEVSLAKQVFLYIQDGVVTRTLATSTGRSFTYRSAPYTVQRKAIADGPRYRALYLNPGYVLAIHGYPSVPTYPASDGCVRLPKWDMDDLRATDGSTPMIPDGTLVYIR